MKKQRNILLMLQWLVVLVALAIAATQLTVTASASYWLVEIGIGLSCIGFAEACSALIQKKHAIG